MSRHTDASLTSGTSPSARSRRIHLIGPGAVGRALLQRIANSRHTLVAVTDSTGTIAARSGVDATAIIEWKLRGRPLAEHAQSTNARWTEETDRVDADIVIDATSSEPRDGWSTALQSSVLERDRALVLVAKNSLAERAAFWLRASYSDHVGCNAVLGGTGHAFQRALNVLRTHCTGLAIVGNASTTSIITTIERGGSLEDGITTASLLGYLEADPELDLRGTDAAVKLAIVAGAIHGRLHNPAEIRCQDIRALDPAVLRARAQRGLTTRLVARVDADGTAGVAYEAVPVDSVLAVPCGRVIYQYDVAAGDRHIYIGAGLGADATAAAAWVDVQSLARFKCVTAAPVRAGAA